ncbi:MAG: heme lyase CcmF/NrfE family subunit [Gammaproteobacteria bacterium]|nr:heme lyase CcmF/NrfE family subunit [Gammaproteobacteria bacterium]NNF60446.1 heme lyase CcmF/NrfE family subunit [Gammaproteobacteria bacterium]NNM21792.1 heme lyase CcmF/NrfE family subunit [Gammaproteobacteria bacterium]
MLPEIGQVALIIAMLLAVAQFVLGIAGGISARAPLIAAVKSAAAGQFVFVAIAFAILTTAFLQDDFSVLYVAQNSNLALPTPYKVAAVWGAHEGSLLLWSLILAAWTIAVAAFSSSLADRFVARVLGVMGMVGSGFMLFMLSTSNPFARLIPAAANGRDLNPLLQDPALVLHPPMLYVGYVGFSVAFAFAVAAMLEGRIDQTWARWVRPWTTTAWAFLTGGIALGSWWAYYELGWGGWWFWDPVENASFMPWLVGTALIHSLAVTEKRGLFYSWTLLLSVSAFSLSLLGTFLVRSGILVSVHAFASDPERGRFILIYMVVVVLGSLLLYAWRAPRMVAKQSGFALASRETFLLLNNMLLVVATLVVLSGTLYPLLHDALGFGKVSVGPPWFEMYFLLPMWPLLVLVGVGMHAGWRKTAKGHLQQQLKWPFWVGLVAAIVFPLFLYRSGGALTAMGIGTAFWILASVVTEIVSRWKQMGRISKLPRGVTGMVLAHAGIGIVALGIVVTSAYSDERDVSLRPGESVEMRGYNFKLLGIGPVTGPNWRAEEATVEVRQGNELIATLSPQKRVYLVQTNAMTESAIDASVRRDLYVAMGEPLGDGAWSMRFQVKPLVRFIWLGALVMLIGGAIAASDRRYRKARAQLPAAGGATERA